MNFTLQFEISHRNDLSEIDIQEMFDLMNSNYFQMDFKCFKEDLNLKDWVCLLRNNLKSIKGFTTAAYNPPSCQSADYNVFFSGDTIIDPQYWGSQEIVKGFCYIAGMFKSFDPQKPLYWFLISKGHRTYEYLPLFFKNYIPRLDSDKTHPYVEILNNIATQMYPEKWDPETGLVKPLHETGFLNSDLTQVDSSRSKTNLHIQFFYKQNPYFSMGYELACLTELCQENMHKRIVRYMVVGENHEIIDKMG